MPTNSTTKKRKPVSAFGAGKSDPATEALMRQLPSADPRYAAGVLSATNTGPLADVGQRGFNAGERLHAINDLARGGYHDLLHQAVMGQQQPQAAIDPVGAPQAGRGIMDPDTVAVGSGTASAFGPALQQAVDREGGEFITLPRSESGQSAITAQPWLADYLKAQAAGQDVPPIKGYGSKADYKAIAARSAELKAQNATALANSKGHQQIVAQAQYAKDMRQQGPQMALVNVYQRAGMGDAAGLAAFGPEGFKALSEAQLTRAQQTLEANKLASEGTAAQKAYLASKAAYIEQGLDPDLADYHARNDLAAVGLAMPAPAARIPQGTFPATVGTQPAVPVSPFAVPPVGSGRPTIYHPGPLGSGDIGYSPVAAPPSSTGTPATTISTVNPYMPRDYAAIGKSARDLPAETPDRDKAMAWEQIAKGDFTSPEANTMLRELVPSIFTNKRTKEAMRGFLDNASRKHGIPEDIAREWYIKTYGNPESVSWGGPSLSDAWNAYMG